MFFREKLKDGRRLESVLGRGPDEPIELSFDMDAGIEVGGYLFCFLSSSGLLQESWEVTDPLGSWLYGF